MCVLCKYFGENDFLVGTGTMTAKEFEDQFIEALRYSNTKDNVELIQICTMI